MVWVQIDACINHRRGEAIHAAGNVAPSEFMGVILGVIGGDQSA
jgi:hypothetical protein